MVADRHDNRPAARAGGVAIAAALGLVIVTGLGGHVLQGTVFGSTHAGGDPVQLLGKTLLETTCATAPLPVGSGTQVVCADWTAVTSTAGVVEVVSLYGPGNATVDAYPAALPQGLAWGTSLDAVWAALGQPIRITGIYGTPTLVYAFDAQPYGSLELRFDADDLLMAINASLVR